MASTRYFQPKLLFPTDDSSEYLKASRRGPPPSSNRRASPYESTIGNNMANERAYELPILGFLT